MARLLLILTLIVFALPAAALDEALSNQAAPKPVSVVVPPLADPEVIRQGGDNIDDAFVIDALPFSDTGTTVGYNDDYDQSCPYGLSPTPDVCYLITPDHDLLLTVDLCGSFYDTKTFIYGPDWQEIACNEDYYGGPPCGRYVSRIDAAPLEAGLSYLICIDGYAGSTGDYLLEIYEYVPCDLTIPTGAVPEGEPQLEDGYHDAYNGGCNSPQFGYPFQHLAGDTQGELIFAGVGGWYDGDSRDTDWFTAEFGPTGVIEITFVSEIRSYLLEVGPHDCAEIGVINSWPLDDCESIPVQLTGDPGSTVWLMVTADTFMAPAGWDDNEYDYLLDITGLAVGPVTVENHSWSDVKSLFR